MHVTTNPAQAAMFDSEQVTLMNWFFLMSQSKEFSTELCNRLWVVTSLNLTHLVNHSEQLLTDSLTEPQVFFKSSLIWVH